MLHGQVFVMSLMSMALAALELRNYFFRHSYIINSADMFSCFDC